MAKFAFEYDDETRQISGPGLKVSEIWNAICGELERQKRWHATRDAVLTGLYARGADTMYAHEARAIQALVVDLISKMASVAADRIHGRLDPSSDLEIQEIELLP